MGFLLISAIVKHHPRHFCKPSPDTTQKMGIVSFEGRFQPVPQWSIPAFDWPPVQPEYGTAGIL
jgi:hypothetical protein